MELEFDISAHTESFFFFAQWDHQLLECQDHLHYRALKWAFCLSDLRQLVVMRALAQAEMNLMKALKHTQPLFRRFERLCFLAHHWTVVIIRGHPCLAFCRQTAEALKSLKTVCEHNGYSDIFCHSNVTLYASAGIKWMLLSPEGPFNINTFLIRLFCSGTAKLHLHFLYLTSLLIFSNERAEAEVHSVATKYTFLYYRPLWGWMFCFCLLSTSITEISTFPDAIIETSTARAILKRFKVIWYLTSKA